MSPEQVQGLPLDPRTDIYSFGVTGYHMLSGQPPFRSGTAFEVALQHVQAEPEPLTKIRPDLPASLCAIVHKMMAKKPDDRYQTSRDLLRDLSKLRDTVTGATATLVAPSLAEITENALTRPGPPKSRTSIESAPAPLISTQDNKRRWWYWALPASIVVALLAGSALGFLNRRPTAKSDASSTDNIDLGQVEIQLSPNKREQTLRDTAKLYGDPGKDQDKIRFGLEVNRELALLYLDQGRWEEANQLFQELMKNGNQVEIYAQFGKLGHAIILGLESKSIESNKLFGDCLPLLPDKQRSKKIEARDLSNHVLVVLGNPKIRQWIAEALEYNYKNDPTNFPRRLEPWRKGMLAAASPGGKSDKTEK
jgi:serine/threonine-protein kinase